MFSLGETSKKNLDGVNPELIKVVRLALVISKVDFGIPSTGGYRTEAEQLELYNSGKSTLDGLNKRSKHQSGNAFDVFPYVNGKANYEEKNLLQVATAILCAASRLGVSLNWGGHWRKFVDMPHFELTTIE